MGDGDDSKTVNVLNATEHKNGEDGKFYVYHNLKKLVPGQIVS